MTDSPASGATTPSDQRAIDTGLQQAANENACAKYFSVTFKLLWDHFFATEHDVNECDPYVKITFESTDGKKTSRQTAPVIGGGRNVKFGDGDGKLMKFPIGNGDFEEAKLKISVYDEDFGKDDKIGGTDTTVKALRELHLHKYQKAEELGDKNVPPPSANPDAPIEMTVKITDSTNMFAGNVHMILTKQPDEGMCQIELVECHGLKTQRVNDQFKEASFYNFAKTILTFAVYVMIIGGLFYFIEPDTFSDYGDACWFAIVTMSTVGYGDYFPLTPAGRYLNCFMIVVGTYIFGGIFSRILTFVVARRDKAKRKRRGPRMGGPMISAMSGGHVHTNIRGQYKHDTTGRILVMMGVFGVLLVVGCLFFKYYEPSQDDGESSFENLDVAVHFLFVTVTTVGYGDVSPGSFLGRVFGSVFIVLGVTLLAEITSLWIEHFELVKQKKLRQVVMEQSLTSMDEFEYFDQDGESDGVIEKHEFLGKMLILIDACDYTLINEIMNRFSELDVDGSGHLDKNDFLTRDSIGGDVEDAGGATSS